MLYISPVIVSVSKIPFLVPAASAQSCLSASELAERTEKRYIWGLVRDFIANVPQRTDHSDLGLTPLMTGRNMSTTEALRMQLDQLQIKYNLLEVENRSLREVRAEHLEELDLERELTETRQENVQLLKTITSLEAKLE